MNKLLDLPKSTKYFLVIQVKSMKQEAASLVLAVVHSGDRVIIQNFSYLAEKYRNKQAVVMGWAGTSDFYNVAVESKEILLRAGEMVKNEKAPNN